MSNIHMHVPFKNESVLLKHLVPIWNTYPVDEWVFFNDGSTDDSVDIVNTLDAKVTFVNRDNCFAIDGNWHETNVRQAMLEYSRQKGAEFAIAIDADEFLSSNMVSEINDVLRISREYQVDSYWYNFVEDIYHIRQDAQYINNYKSCIMHIPSTYNFVGNLIKHTPRTAPNKFNQTIQTKEWGLMHLQSMSVKFYALKQLWYKHWEYHVENRTVDMINARYDPVVNNLNFNPVEISKELVEGVSLDKGVFDELLDYKNYQEYVQQNLVPELVTFGKEFLEN